MTRKRYGILALIFVTVVINYMDRSNISVAAAAIGEDLDLTKVQLGFIFSAFGLTYSLLQIPGGILADHVRPRLLYPIILVLWSLATLLQGVVSSLAALIGLRASIGVFEAPSYPMNNRIVTSWFPEQERASAIAVYTSGQFIGLAFLTPLLVTVQFYFGWRGLFVFSGIVGIVWAAIWWFAYRSPRNHATVSRSELDMIAAGGGLIDNVRDDRDAGRVNFTLSDLREAFVHRKLWGIYLGQFCLVSLFTFFLTWFPTYLVEFRGLDFIQSGFLASIPFLAAFVGVLLSGFVSDALVRRGTSNEASRKGPIILGMLLSTLIIGANYTDSTPLIIFFLAVAFFGNGLASITWVFVSLLAPERLIGLVGGVFNFIGGLGAVVTPVVIGYLAEGGSFDSALLFVGLMAFAGGCSYVFLVGKIQRVREGSKV